MVITTSAARTASAALPNTVAPLASAAAIAAGAGSKPRTACSPATRFAAIGPPILPRPRNAIVVKLSALLCAGAYPGGFSPADDHPHDLVGALQDAVHPQVAHDLFQTILAQIAVAAVQLQRLVRDVV